MQKQFPFAILLGLAACFTACRSSDNLSGKPSSTPPDSSLEIRSDFKKYFEPCRAEGSVVIFDYEKNKWMVSDTIESKTGTLPASTFKIANLLIALETGVIKSVNDIVKWPGSTDTLKYGFRPDIYHDMSVREAFELSAGWVFVELSRQIGKEKYREYLSKCGYGNVDLSQEGDDFWNFGAFAISPVNQVLFLKNLYEGNLPFSRRTMKLVKKVMTSEIGDSFKIHSKTGWTREGGVNTGWWVGYVRKRDNVYFFATRLLQDRQVKSATFGNCRKEITRAALKDLGILP